MARSRSEPGSSDIEKVSYPDHLGRLLLVAGIASFGAAAVLRGPDLLMAAATTARPFGTVAIVVVVGWAGVRAGWFDRVGRSLPLDRPRTAVAAVLVLTAIVSGAVNLDVAVVVAAPLALGVAAGAAVDGALLLVAVANVANAASFLLPTSNLTNLLVMGTNPLPPVTYLGEAWLAWIGVTVVTVAAVTCLAARSGSEAVAIAPARDWPLRRVLGDLGAMFLVATGLRALLARPIALPGGPALQTMVGGTMASILNNLPVASVIRAGAGAPWPAILAMGAGSNLLVTGSVATVICRRYGREGGVGFPIVRFTLLGVVLLPVQVSVAFLGLRLLGAGP